MKKYSLYLFDFDGTLLDTSLGLNYVFKESFKVAGVTIKDEDILYLSRVPLSQSFIEFHADESKINEFINRIEESLDEYESISTTRKYNETDEFIDYIKKNNILTGIVTSNNTNHVDKVFDYMKIDKNLFKVKIGSNKCKLIKPDPTPILMALEEIGYINRKNEVIYVGDSVNDCLSAKNAGIDYVLIDRDNSSTLDFPKINTLMELFN